jgi:hypothetical protein
MLILQRLQWAGLIRVVELVRLGLDLRRDFLCRPLRLGILDRASLRLGVDFLYHTLDRQPVHDLGHDLGFRHASGRDADALGQGRGCAVALRVRFGARLRGLPFGQAREFLVLDRLDAAFGDTILAHNVGGAAKARAWFGGWRRDLGGFGEFWFGRSCCKTLS